MDKGIFYLNASDDDYDVDGDVHDLRTKWFGLVLIFHFIGTPDIVWTILFEFGKTSVEFSMRLETVLKINRGNEHYRTLHENDISHFQVEYLVEPSIAIIVYVCRYRTSSVRSGQHDISSPHFAHNTISANFVRIVYFFTVENFFEREFKSRCKILLKTP